MAAKPDSEQAGLLWKQALGLINSNKNREAAHVLEQAIALDPTNAPLVKVLAILWSDLSEHIKAKEVFTQYIRLLPNEPKAYINRGAVNLELGLVDEAIEDYKRAADLGPQNSDTLIWLANAYDRAGRFSDALT